ncbi:hypothetical protein CHLRE_10g430200v5 [Chlamydomonas reinhardtii]|uniref:Sulfatase N-terminal domain-containing protein n=1 Tax=Chlamydomonas reinhardtii TaxID=3055 RepID=A8IBH3_CHLRE|nr:uncharacterized protein CHLRE_10g430200v5 [Chlamydomonas reinhardtii]XP_042920030.1 uncharacterized protein CHLRE_10g430200v5 [Chlamydomonas reinhardtii]PNW77293.1 hypothetical protein CHLRE_10g430200v5 [Chlamydomonas reinhardtii]PNW77294.1 hypothetical protein CHLRE_10g430200v5 [Chlamydomonas reinhardtii]|eukprot:XP_001702516.1 arylsulfatase [Chlamydomonas reinhardtii]
MTFSRLAPLLLLLALCIDHSFVGAQRKAVREGKDSISAGKPPLPLTPATAVPSRVATKPSFVVVLVDDLDQLLNSTDRTYLPLLHSLLGDQGLRLRNMAISSSTCCPSRTSLLTGLFTHNHGITANLPPYGGWSKFLTTRPDDQSDTWMPSQLQKAGYNVYSIGKFLNGFAVGPGSVCPRGFTVLDALVDPYVYSYFGPGFSKNCGTVQKYGDSDYSTDVIRDKAIGYLREAVAAGQPFYMQVNPIAPHERCKDSEEGGGGRLACDNAIPAPRHAYLFRNASLPRSANWMTPLPESFRAAVAASTDSVRSGKELGAVQSSLQLNTAYRQRLRAMASVDEMLGDIVQELSAQGVLDSTHIIFTSDNGYHMGNHNFGQGKTLPYEEDVRVPFFIRGPGLPRGLVSDYPTTMVDVPATVLALAGINLPGGMDGYPIPFHRIMPTAYAPALGAKAYDVPSAGLVPGGRPYMRDNTPIEMWIHTPGAPMNGVNFRSVRVCTSYLAFGTPATYRQAMATASRNGSRAGSHIGLGDLLFSAGDRTTAGDALGVDLDMYAVGSGSSSSSSSSSVRDRSGSSGSRAAADSGSSSSSSSSTGITGTCYKYNNWCFGIRELYDLGLDPAEVNNRYSDPRAARLVQRLEALLSVLAYCKGDRCREAYGAIVGPGRVLGFADLMDPSYDSQIAALRRFEFQGCSPEKLDNELTWYHGG